MAWVTLRGESMKYPPVCACCLRPATTTQLTHKDKVLHLGIARIRRTFRTEVPYCPTCLDHILEHESARLGAILLGGLGVLFLASGVEYCGASVAMKVLPPLPQGTHPLGLAIFLVLALVPWFLAATFVVHGLMRKPSIVAIPPHACKTRSVRVQDFDSKQHTLAFENAEFCRRFIEANAGQVVAKG